MKKSSFFFYVLIAVVVGMVVYMYYYSGDYDLKCVISSKDGNRYCVREREKMKDAADLLAEVGKKLNLMVQYLKERQPDDPRTTRLVEKFDSNKIC